MSKINPFQKPLKDYTHDLNYVEGYIHQQSTLLAQKLNKPYDKVRELVEQQVKEKFKTRKVRLYEKDLETLDMEITEMDLTKFIYSVKTNKMTIAPSFTCYTKVNKDGEKWVSMHSRWTDVNKRSRNEFKKKAKQYEAVGDTDNFIINNTLNIAAKVKNNSVSGKSSLLKYPTSRHSSHYSMTSFTRILTSSANSLSESIVMGNRLYYKPMDVMRHIASIITYSDMELVQKAIDKYKLKIPTTEDIMNMVLYNTYYYWRSTDYMDKIHGYVDTLTDVQKVAYLYTFDMYHIHKLNKTLIEAILTALSAQHTANGTIEEVTEEEDYKINLLHHVCFDELKGLGIKHGDFKGKQIEKVLSGTMRNINSVLKESELLIKAFFMSQVIPPNASMVKDAVRRVIVLSDTDSTVSFYYHYVKAKYGKFELNNESIAYSASASIFVSESIRNVLIQLGKNMNVEEDVMSEIDMKSEYMFSSFMPTYGSKHYIEKTVIKELIQMLDKVTFHGVSLIANKVLAKYTDKKKALVKSLIHTVESGGRVDLKEIISFIKTLEIEIIEMIKNADSSIFLFSDVKGKKDYKIPMSSQYFHYELWEQVFAEKYGHVETPPYLAMKVSIDLSTKKKIEDMISSIEDAGIRERWAVFFEKYPKGSMTQVIVPYEIVKSQGLPIELFNIIDKNKIVENTLSPFYNVMEILGIIRRDGLLYSEQF